MSAQPSGAQMLSLMEQYYNVGLRYCFVKNKPVLLKKHFVLDTLLSKTGLSC